MSWYRTAAGRGLAPLLAVLVLVLVAGSSTSAPASAAKALDFTGTTLSDHPFNGATLMGTPVVLWFWLGMGTVILVLALTVAIARARRQRAQPIDFATQATHAARPHKERAT